MSDYFIYLAGDSTVENVFEGYKSGWGQQIPLFFSDNVHFINEAKGGRSTKSFMNDGRLDAIRSKLKNGDYLFIQFGHNDQKIVDPLRGTDLPTYQNNLKIYIECAREKGAIPILVTPVCRRNFDESGQIIMNLGEFPNAMREVAKTLDVQLIDLTNKSKLLYESLGVEESKKLFAWYEHPHQDKPDNTHFSAYGAKRIAELVIEGIVELELPFAHYLIKEYK